MHDEVTVRAAGLGDLDEGVDVDVSSLGCNGCQLLVSSGVRGMRRLTCPEVGALLCPGIAVVLSF